MNRIEKQKSYAKMSENDFKDNQILFKDLKESKQKYGDEFDFDKWADGVDGLSDHVKECLSDVDPLTVSFEEFANALGKTTKSGTQFGSAIKGVVVDSLKSLGKTLLGTGLNVLINGVFGYALEWIVSSAVKIYDKLAHEQENIIQKSKESAKAIADNYASIQSGKQWKKANAERFTELAQGIGKQGENLSLTSSEFEEYQGLALELSNIMPSLVTGFNELGQPILAAAGNMSTLNEAFRAEEIKKYNENIRKTSDVLKGFKTQYDEKGTIFKESGLKQKVAAYKDILSAYAAVKDVAKDDANRGNIELYNKLSDKSGKKYNHHVVKDIAKQLDIKASKLYENIDLIEEGYQDALAEMENVANSVKDTLPSFFNVKDSYNKLINAKGNENIDGFMRSVMSQLDNEFVLNNLKDTGDIKSWSNSIIDDLEKSGVQEAIGKLYEIDSKKSSMNFKDYNSQVNELVHKIDKDVKNLDFNQIMAGFDLGDELKDLEADYNKVSGISKDLANTLSNSDLELAGRLISEQDISNAEQLKEALILAKQAAFDINANPIFDSVAKAKESKNAGADYVQAKTYLDETKELYDKGLTGTDEFKAFAKYLSPTGAEDEVNFLENYTKAAKYLTEDSTGVVNFLNDLSTKTDEAGNSLATFDKSTGKWSYNISDLAKGAEQMGMGFEFFMDMFGRLEDYGFSNNFFSTQEEGLKKITDKTIKLAQAEAELAELQSEGQYTTVDENGETHKTKGNQTAIDAKKKEIEGYKSDLEQLESTLDQVIEKQVQAANARVETARQSFDILKQKRDEILASNEFGDNTAAVIEQIDEQLRAYAAEGGLELDASLNIVNTEEITEQAQKIIEDAKTSVEKVQNLVTSNGSGVTINLDSDNIADVEAQMVSIMDSVESLKDKSGTIPIDAPGAEDAMNVLSALVIRRQELIKPIVMGIDTSQLNSDVSTVITAVQEFQTAYNELQRLNTLQSAGFQVNSQEIDNAKAKVDEALNKVRELDNEEATADIKAKLQIDDTSAGALVSSINGITAGMIESVNVPVDATVKGKEDVDALNDSISKVKSKSVSITASVSDTTKVNNLANAINSLPTNKDIYVTTHYSSQTGEASGTMLSPAHANGTAYNTLNMSSAYAGGSVALPKNEEALVNEVGVESIVRDGVWSLLPGGAHIEQLKKGDIIFNASQTEQLLKYGSIAGHGIAHADGTVGNIRSLVSTSLNAYRDGTGFGSGGGYGSSSTLDRGQGSGSSKDKNKGKGKGNKSNGSDISKNMDKASDSAKEFEETLDHIVTLIDRTERTIKNLERIAGSTFETLATRTNALNSELTEVTKEIDIQSKAYDRYLKEANSVGLAEDYAEKVRNGLIDLETITDETLNENINKYKEYYEKALDCRDAVEELKETVKELYEESFNNLVTEYDNMLSMIEHRKNILDGYINQTEAQGYIVSTKYYAELIKNEQNILDNLTKKKQDLITSLNNAVSSGNIKMYSEAWYDMQSEISATDEAIQDANTSIIEFGNSIRDIKWEVFDKIQDQISGITDEADFLIDLMSNDKLFDDKGKITDQGKATMGLHGVNYNTYMSQADQYRKEMESIQAELAKDPYNQQLIERRKELLELQQESILAAEDEKQAIKDLVADGIEKQLDALQKLIDKQTDMLDSQKDMYDWQKQVAEKQKEIATLEKQLSAYAGDDSEEGAAKRQELGAELSEAKTDLDETFFEKSIDEQKKMLDELYNEYSLILNTRLDNIDLLITDMISNINAESSGIKETITTEANSVGYKITDSMEKIWGSSGTIATILSTYNSNFLSTMTTLQQTINDIKVYIQNAVEASNKKANANISSANKNQAQQTKPPVAKPAPPAKPVTKPTTNSNSTGDGTPKIGDAVTFTSGRYYYSSDGISPSGNQMLGQTVYIGHINKASWAKKPYAIYRDKAFKHPLGWVTLDQLKGYKTGKKRIDEDQLAMINEKGVPETLVRKDGTMVVPLSEGDSVLNHKAHENIWEMANNPRDFIQNYAGNYSLPSMARNLPSQTIENTVDVNISIDKVTDFDNFVNQLQSSNKFEKLIQSMTIDKIAGKPTLSKFNIKL